MQMITLAGPPSSGKTSTLIRVAARFQADGARIAAVKFDTLSSQDHLLYQQRLGAPALVGLSDYICPDHYYVSNIEEAYEWGKAQGADILFVETAGLCHRCAPHIVGVPAVTVIDNLGGVETPRKMGPALEKADLVVLTKSDLVSQAEREVFAHSVSCVNATAQIVFFNGLTGTGSLLLKRHMLTLFAQRPNTFTTRLGEKVGAPAMSEQTLRSSLPACICSYCTGETRIGRAYQSGNIVKICLPDGQAHAAGCCKEECTCG